MSIESVMRTPPTF